MPYSPMACTASEQTWEPREDDYIWTGATAASITLPSNGYRLVRVFVTTAAKHSYLKLIYDGANTALFPTWSNGTSGANAWAVTWPCPSTVLPASFFVFGNADAGNVVCTNVVLTFSKGRSKGPPIERYRSINCVVLTAAGGVTVPTIMTAAVNFPSAPAVPTGVIALSTLPLAGVQFFWPQVGGISSGHPADCVAGSMSLGSAPKIPKQFNFTGYYQNLAVASVMSAFVGYDPV